MHVLQPFVFHEGVRLAFILISFVASQIAMASQQLVAHVEAAVLFLGQISAAQRVQALVGQVNAVKVMIQKISGQRLTSDQLHQ